MKKRRKCLLSKKELKKVEKAFLCLDCKVDTCTINEYYMLKNEIWDSVVTGDGMLCIGCVETRLGRTLVPDDFASCMLNEEEDGAPIFWKSVRLRDRMDLGKLDTEKFVLGLLGHLGIDPADVGFESSL